MKIKKIFVLIGLMPVIVLGGCWLEGMPESENLQLEGAQKASQGSVIDYGWYVEKTGEIGPGSRYALYYPTATAWNRKLVMYAHGYVMPGQPIWRLMRIPGRKR